MVSEYLSFSFLLLGKIKYNIQTYGLLWVAVLTPVIHGSLHKREVTGLTLIYNIAPIF